MIHPSVTTAVHASLGLPINTIGVCVFLVLKGTIAKKVRQMIQAQFCSNPLPRSNVKTKESPLTVKVLFLKLKNIFNSFF